MTDKKIAIPMADGKMSPFHQWEDQIPVLRMPGDRFPIREMILKLLKLIDYEFRGADFLRQYSHFGNIGHLKDSHGSGAQSLKMLFINGLLFFCCYWHGNCQLSSYTIVRSFFYPTRGDNPMAKPKIKPLADRILVKRLDDDDEQKVGGIIIPDTAKEKPQEAEVVAVGPGKLDGGSRVTPELKKGDKVLIGKYSGTEVKIEDEEFLIMREEDVLAIVG